MQAAGNVPILDKVPGYNLYIGGIIALRRPKALANCNITHVVSHLHISVDDVDEENLLEHFSRSNAFIKAGVNCRGKDGKAISQPILANEWTGEEGGSCVLIHCAMGKSRSSAVLIAYLLYASSRAAQSHPPPSPDSDTTPLPPQPLTFESALVLVRRGRPLVEPNDGFESQLRLYHKMGCPDDPISHPLYQRWLYRQNVEESLSVNQAPGMDIVRFEDEHEADYEDVGNGIAVPTANVDSSARSTVDLKCRKCRRLLAKSSFTVEHSPPEGRVEECQHIFLHPLSWMKGALEAGELEGG